MSTPNPSESVDTGASTTAPISIDEEIDQVGDASNPPLGKESDMAARKRKKRKISTIWEDVTEVEENGVNVVKCNHCLARLSISKVGPMTSYSRHIQKCQIRLAKISGKGKGSGGVQSISSHDSIGSGSLSAGKYDKEAIKDITAKMIMVHEYPLEIVEHKLFRLHNKMLNPRYEPFGRAAIEDHVMKLYREEKAKLKEMFSHVGMISLTFDLWTSNQTKGYMCITGHYLDADWKLQNRILNFCLLPLPHSGVAIADKMIECLSEWGIEDKISTITFDNASLNDAAIRSLKELFQGRGVPYFGGKIFHIRSCAHILNLLVQDALIPLKSAIERIRESVKHIILSPACLHKWTEVVKNMSLPTNKSLILDDVTQWSSTFHMLERALIFKDSFQRYAIRDTSYRFLPSEEDWEIARDICKFLSIFNEVTEIFSGRKYTTSNLYFIEIWRIREILDAMADDPREFMKLMVHSMKEKFDKYWNECNLFMMIAAVLDPQNKMMLMKYTFGKLYDEEEVEERLGFLTKEMHSLFDDYVAKASSVGSGANVHSTDVGRGEITVDSERKEFEDWVRTTSSAMPTRKEIEVYLNDEGLLLGCGGLHFDVLGWWKSNAWRFPNLSKMARDILSIPVTTVPSESAFSAGRRVISDDWCSLGDDTIEGLFCASNWFRHEFSEGLLSSSETSGL